MCCAIRKEMRSSLPEFFYETFKKRAAAMAL